MDFLVGECAPAWAVDLIGVHDLAVKSDPRLQAAAYRRDATSENKAIARANLLPQIGAGGAWSRGDSETDIPGFEQTIESDIDTDNYRLELRQSLYRQANYEALDIARGQISQADAIYQIVYQDFLLRVAERYFLVLTLTDGVTFAEAEEKAFQRQFEQAEQRFEVGLTAVTDVHESRASYDNARARAIVARNDLEDAKEALRELTGEYFEEYDALQEVLPLVEPDPVAADEWVDIALQNNPSVVALISPSGNTINLSNRRGGNGDNFNNTIFSMTGNTAIANGAAPFNGSYIPDGSFNSLTGNANGTWQLKVSDVAGADIGTINSWTLSLNNVVPSQVTYSWTSAPTGVTSSAANPVVTPAATTTYTVVATNTTNGCTGNASVAITVNPIPVISITGTNAICAGSGTSLTAAARAACSPC